MFSIKKNLPPKYGEGTGELREDFERFFQWGLDLQDPHKQIPEMAHQLGFGAKVHPLGFHVVYLSEQDHGALSPQTGVVRANFFPPGVKIREDVHSHGFDFHSGVAQGGFTNLDYGRFSDFPPPTTYGVGLVGYEGRVNETTGENETVLALKPVVVLPKPRRQELSRGSSYTMPPKDYFHGLGEFSEGPTVTIFCKSPNYGGSRGISMTLRDPNDAPVPEEY